MPKVANKQILLFIAIIKLLYLIVCQNEIHTLPLQEFPLPIATGEKRYQNPPNINGMMDTAQIQTRPATRYREISLHLTKPNLAQAKFLGQSTNSEIHGCWQISILQKVLVANSSKLGLCVDIPRTNSMVLRLEVSYPTQLREYDKFIYFVNTTHSAVHTVRMVPEPFCERKHKSGQLTCEVLRIRNLIFHLIHHVHVIPSPRNQDYTTLHFVSLISETTAIICNHCIAVYSEEHAKRGVPSYDESNELVDLNGTNKKIIPLSCSLERNWMCKGGHSSDAPLPSVQWINMLISYALSLMILLIVNCYPLIFNVRSIMLVLIIHRPHRKQLAIQLLSPMTMQWVTVNRKGIVDRWTWSTLATARPLPIFGGKQLSWRKMAKRHRPSNATETSPSLMHTGYGKNPGPPKSQGKKGIVDKRAKRNLPPYSEMRQDASIMAAAP